MLHYEKCSQNLCPLDFELKLRSGKKSDGCRFMREAKTSKIAGREFVSGGYVMPNALLNFIPEDNLNCLNNASRDQWNKLKEKMSK